MKARFLALAALVLGLASCQNDFEGGGIATGGEVGFQLSVAAPELAGTRAGEDGKADNQNAMDSAFGAIDYLQGAATGDYRQDWGDVDIRYVLEVYDYKENDKYDGAEPVKNRQVIIKDSYEPVIFDIQLVPNRMYHFVVFADFVANGNATLSTDEQLTVKGIRHEIGKTLADIKLFNEAINDEVADAYFATNDFKVVDATPHNMVLKRPYGKLRVIATDLAELNLNLNPKSVTVKYESFNPNAFNAVTGAISGKYTTNEFSTEFVDNVRSDMGSHYYTAGYDAKTYTAPNGAVRNSHITLFTDYILGVDDQKAVHFTMSVNDQDSVTIKTTEFRTDIPIARNKLTTVIGNVLTTASEIKVTIDDNFANVDDEDDTNDYDYTLLETLMNGGKFTLTEDMTITEPTNLRGDAIIDLNGYTLNYVASKDDNKHAIMTRVENGSSLRFIGQGEVKSTGYIASANEGGTIYITEGKFTTTGCTLFQANGGKVYISGGEFKANEYDGDYRFTLNHVDSMKNVGKIEVTGGKFYMYDPSKSASENPEMNFVKDGFVSLKDGDWYIVMASKDYVDMGDYMEVYTAKGLAKWAYTVNNVDGKLAYGLKLMADITLPQYEIVADAVNETYLFDDTKALDGTNSNWIPVCSVEKYDDDTFKGQIDGENNIISGLRINNTQQDCVGFVGFMAVNSYIKNLTFDNAVVNGKKNVGVAAGRAQDGTIVENVKVNRSKISGSNNVGAIAGYNYSRVGGAQGQGFAEGPAVVRMCQTDEYTEVNCSGDNAGGIVGYNYGATIIACDNHADVTGASSVGGIVGYTRDYHHNKDGYIVACRSYEDATITADGNVGGIAGFTLADSQHTNTYMHIVACASFSKIVGAENAKKGCIIGVISHRQHTAGCVAVNNGAEKLYGSGAPTTDSSVVDAILYDNLDDFSKTTQEDLDKLNDAIEHYNSKNPPAEAKCDYHWDIDNVNNSPVLRDGSPI